MHIGVVGVGYVGLVTGACFAEFGMFVTCVDKDEKKVKTLKKGEIPFFEPGLKELVTKNIEQGRLRFSTRIADAVESSLVVFIAVGTPPRGDGSTELKYIEEVAQEIGRHIDGYKVIATKSTVPVGTGRKMRRIISKNLRKKVDFDMVSNPEFLREGSAIEDFMRPDRVVIGADSQQAVAIMKDLYNPLYLIETPVVTTDIQTAELIKYASNCFLATKISFINDMAVLCEKVGADVHMVAKAMGLDRRIGPKFLHPGPGFGGSCFPKDIKALIHISGAAGVDMRVVKAALSTNEAQIAAQASKVKSALGGLRGKTVAVLGLSFKPNTDDIREAPALHIIKAFLKEKAKVKAYDPAAMENAKAEIRGITYCKGPYDTVKGADALVIVTEWNEFRNLELDKIKKLLKRPVFFDLRNVYDPRRMRELGFEYHSTGRP